MEVVDGVDGAWLVCFHTVARKVLLNTAHVVPRSWKRIVGQSISARDLLMESKSAR